MNATSEVAPPSLTLIRDDCLLFIPILSFHILRTQKILRMLADWDTKMIIACSQQRGIYGREQLVNRSFAEDSAWIKACQSPRGRHG